MVTPWTSNALTPEQFRDEMVAWCRVEGLRLWEISELNEDLLERAFLLGQSRGHADMRDLLRAATFHPLPPDGAHN